MSGAVHENGPHLLAARIRVLSVQTLIDSGNVSGSTSGRASHFVASAAVHAAGAISEPSGLRKCAQAQQSSTIPSAPLARRNDSLGRSNSGHLQALATSDETT